MKIRKINKIIALIIIASIVVTNIQLNISAQYENSYKEVVENTEKSEEITEDTANNKDAEKAEASVVEELTDLRTTNTTTYLLSDGSRKLEINGANIRYKDGEKLKEYNTDLKKVSTNNIKELKEISKENDAVLENGKIEEYVYVNTAGDSKLYFPTKLDGKMGILLKKNNYAISFSPLSEEQKKSGLEETDTMPLDINNVRESNITYWNEREKVEYQYTSLSFGVKEEIVLKERLDTNIFEFHLNLSDMKIEKDEFAKRINLIDKKTREVVAYIDAPNIKDQSGEVKYEEVSYEIENLGEDQYTLKVIVDDNYLNSPDTKYPVVIDPTVVWMDSFLPCATLSNNPATANSNFKVGAYFEVQNQGITTTSGLKTEYMCYIQTNTSPLSGEIGQLHGSKVESARLKIVEYNMGRSYQPGIIEVRTPKRRWGEYTLTWNNHPEVEDKVWAQFTTTGTTGRGYNVDLTSWAQAVADEEIGNYGLVLKAKNQGTGAGFYGPSLQNIRYLQLSIVYYPYVTTVNHYYDNAYDVRYSQAKYGNTPPANVIKQHQDWVGSVFETLFSLKIISNTPQKYTSLADRCKLNQGLAIDVTSINKQCPKGAGHGYVDKYITYTECTKRKAVHKSFIEDKPSNDVCCNVLWTGNQLYENGEPYDRANFGYDSVFIYETQVPDERVDQERRTIMHELAHNFGALDEYCYDEKIPAGGDCGAPRCPIHHPERFIGDCIMGYAMYDSDRISTPDNIFCEYCIEDIKTHLEDHHKKSTLVVVPNTGETIGEAVIRELGAKNAEKITKIRVTGWAALDTSTQQDELANILPNLENVDLSKFRGTLGEYSFYKCSNLGTVKLPTSIKLPSYTFAQCGKLNTVYKKENVGESGEIDLSDVKSLGDGAFQNTAGEIVRLPETIDIPKYCFKDCTSLRTIYKKGVSPIDREADLTGVKSLGVSAFENAGSFILSVNLPKDVNISDNCFKNWSSLEEVRFNILQTSKVSIGVSAFYGVNSSCIAYMNQMLIDDTDFIIPVTATINMPKQIAPLIVTPNTGETIGQAITRELGIISANSIKKMILRGNADMQASTGNSDSARVLSNLEFVDMSEFHGTLGKFVFFNCSNLTTVVLPTNISIPENAFRDCTKLTTIRRGNDSEIMNELDLSGVTAIGSFAFRNAESISVVKIPTTFVISSHCFMECKKLKTIYKIGSTPVDGEIDLTGVTNIGYAAFYNNLNNINEAPRFNTVKLSASATIPGNCFRNSAYLTTIYIEEKVNGEADLSRVTSFGAGAFSGTSTSNAPKINVVKLPQNVAIPNDCFRNCSNIKEVNFNETQTTKVSIGTEAFYGVNASCIAYMHQTLAKDTSFVLPISDTNNMGKQLYRLIVKPNNGETMKQAITRELGTISAETVKKMKLQGNAVMGAGTSNDDSAKVLSELEKVDLSEFTGRLGKFAFHTCTKLKIVILPTSNVTLPVYAFSDCENLDTVYRAGNTPITGEGDLSGVISAGNYAFMNTAINKVKLPSSFTIPQYCFITCKNLSTIYKDGNVPVEGELDLSGVSSIGYGAFWNYLGNTAKFDTVKLSESCSIGGNCFRRCSNLTTIYKKGKERVEGEADLSGVTSFAEGVFSGMSTSNAPQIGVVVLPKNVAIPNECFKNCSNLKKVKFNETQIAKVPIGIAAFYGVNTSCVAYMHQTLVNDTSFILPMSSTLNMPKYEY